MMVDWLTVELPDPFKMVIIGGEIMRLGDDGIIEWATRCKREFQGSWSSKVQVRNLMAHKRVAPGVDPEMSGLELSGNPAKFLQGHNLFGTDDPQLLARSLVQKLGEVIAPGFDLSGYDPGEGTISRIDLTASWLLDRPEDVLPFLKAMEDRVYCPFRGRGVSPLDGPGTLYYGLSKKGQRAKDWQLKLYSKGRDIVAHPLPKPALVVPGLLDEVNRTIRVELTLRTAELKRLGLVKLKDWTLERVEQVWRSYVDRLDFSDAKMVLDNQDMAGILKARHLDAIASWKAGNDLRVGRAPATFYRLRSEIRDLCGIDIATAVPKSNVVPLRRVIEARPALRPLWADDLTAALRTAA